MRAPETREQLQEIIRAAAAGGGALAARSSGQLYGSCRVWLRRIKEGPGPRERLQPAPLSASKHNNTSPPVGGDVLFDRGTLGA